jgi:hypothetical protein
MLADIIGELDTSSIINVLLSTAGLITAIWAIYTWRRQQLYNSARWQNELVTKFYLSDDFHNIRLHFEFDFFHYYAPACERWDTNKNLLSDTDKSRLAEVDAVVNFFENLLYIISQGHISERDHFAAFSYWYVLMRDQEHAALRQYMRYGFENIQKRTNMVCPTYYLEPVFRAGAFDNEIKAAGAQFQGTCMIRAGHMVQDGQAFIIQDKASLVECNYYLFPEDQSFDTLDEIYKFNPADWTASQNVRRYIRTENPEIGAWLYIKQDHAERFGERASGKWVLDRPK